MPEPEPWREVLTVLVLAGLCLLLALVVSLVLDTPAEWVQRMREVMP